MLSNSWIANDFKVGLVSVIMGTYNRANLVEETLDSVYDQSYRPIELIIVDDGSIDETEDVVKKWIDQHCADESLRVVYRKQENRGVCAARNRGLELSEGEFIQFLDSDDLLHKDRFDSVVRVFQETNCDYVETGFDGFLIERGDRDEIHYGHTGKDQIALLLHGRLWPNTLRPMFRRSLIIRTGPWNESMTTFQDYEYVIRALMQPERVNAESLKEVLASARRDYGPRMSDIIKTFNGRVQRIHCEKLLGERIGLCEYLSHADKSAFVSRIYALGFRCNAEGWTELGDECGHIAASVAVDLDLKGKIRKQVWRAGTIGAHAYLMMGKAKQILMDR